MANARVKNMLKDNTRYMVKMERQEIKVREGASYEGGAKKTVFMTKYHKTNQPKTLVTIPPGFFTTKHNPNPSHVPADPSKPNIAFGTATLSPKVEEKYTYG